MRKPKTSFSVEDYLAWEEQQPERHELYRGETYAMVGGRRMNGIVTVNLASALRSALRGSPCRVFVGSMKLRIASDTIVYPDLFVTCDANDLRTEQVFVAPTVVAEVLSPSTQNWDRGGKFTLYRGVSTLREYVLIDPETREVQLYRRNSVGFFTVHDCTGEAAIRLESLDCELSADEVFEGLDPPIPIAAPAES